MLHLDRSTMSQLTQMGILCSFAIRKRRLVDEKDEGVSGTRNLPTLCVRQLPNKLVGA
jgi:hypothetical protein